MTSPNNERPSVLPTKEYHTSYGIGGHGNMRRKSEATTAEQTLAELKEAKATRVQSNTSNTSSDRDLSSSPEDVRGFGGNGGGGGEGGGPAGGRRRSSVLDMVKGWAGRSAS